MKEDKEETRRKRRGLKTEKHEEQNNTSKRDLKESRRNQTGERKNNKIENGNEEHPTEERTLNYADKL